MAALPTASLQQLFVQACALGKVELKSAAVSEGKISDLPMPVTRFRPGIAASRFYKLSQPNRGLFFNSYRSVGQGQSRCGLASRFVTYDGLETALKDAGMRYQSLKKIPNMISSNFQLGPGQMVSFDRLADGWNFLEVAISSSETAH